MAHVTNRFLGAVVLGLAFACSAVAADAEPAGSPLDIRNADIEYDLKTGLAVAVGTDGKQARIEYKGMVLEADRMQVNRATKDIAAKGNVVFTDGDRVWKGDDISGNLDTKTFASGVFDLKFGPWYGHAESATRDSEGRSTVVGARVTTCDYENPHYSISARRIVYYPNGKFRAYHAVYRVGKVPVFYWPFVLGDTSSDGGNLQIKPGYSSDWGAYLLLAKGYRIGDYGDTTFMLDLRSKNGVAVGNRTRIKLARSETDLLAYGMYDADTPETADGFNRRFETEDWRYRLSLYQRIDLTPDLVFRGQANAFSDIDMLEDWFEKEYDRNPQPYSYADLTWNTERVSLSLSARPRLNDFCTVVEQLPELHVLLPRQPLFDLPLYVQSELTFGHYRMNWSEFDQPLTPGGDDERNAEGYESWRANWITMLYAPFSLGQLHFVPRAGFQAVGYSDSSENAMTDPMLRLLADHANTNYAGYPPLVGPLPAYDDGDDGNAVTNFAGELGMEVSTKFYRTWQDHKNGTLDLDGLRHVVQPYLNYTYVSDPSEERDNLFFFDHNDRLAEMNFVRAGVDQRLQTRRHGRIYTFVSMQTYADFHLNKQEYYSADAAVGAEPDAERGTLGDLGNRIDFRPREGVAFWNTVVFDMDETELSRAELGMSLGRDERKRLTLSYLFRNDYVPRALYSMGSSLLDFSGESNLYSTAHEEAHWLRAELTLPINAKTTGRIALAYDLQDNEIEHSSLEIIRDLHCWMGSVAVGQENGDFFVSVMLSLKAFPSMRLDGEI